MTLLPPSTPPPADVYEFLDYLSIRLGMLQKGGERDHRRAAVWFIKWWREEGGLISASSTPRLSPANTSGRSPSNTPPESAESSLSLDSALTPPERTGWGFDFEWNIPVSGISDPSIIQARMEEKIETHARQLEEEKLSRDNVSLTQEKKQAREEKIARRRARGKVRN